MRNPYAVRAASEEILFRAFLPWFLLKISCLLMLATYSSIAAVRFGYVYWWAGTVLLLSGAIGLACRYSSRAVSIRDANVFILNGMFSVRERRIPLRYTDLEIRQSFLGRLFDYGTVCLHAEGRVFVMKTIAPICALRYLATSQQQELLGSVVERRMLN